MVRSIRSTVTADLTSAGICARPAPSRNSVLLGICHAVRVGQSTAHSPIARGSADRLTQRCLGTEGARKVLDDQHAIRTLRKALGRVR